MLNLMHGSHQVTEKSKARAREVMYWPGMAGDIENTVNRCSKCAEWHMNNQKESLVPHEVPVSPSQKLRADLFVFRGQTYLRVVDYFSKFPEISLLQTKIASSVIIHFKSISAPHGVPDELVQTILHLQAVNCKILHLHWDLELLPLVRAIPSLTK